MKRVHLTSLACFAIATACYLLAWAPGLFGFFAIGAIFEIAAWVKLFSRQDVGGSDVQRMPD